MALVNLTGGWRPKDKKTGKVRKDTKVIFSGFLKEDIQLEAGGKIMIFKNQRFAKGDSDKNYPEIDIVYSEPDEEGDYKRSSKKSKEEDVREEEYGDEDDIPF